MHEFIKLYKLEFLEVLNVLSYFLNLNRSTHVVHTEMNINWHVQRAPNY
jgi:hypothetical protein